MRRIWDIVVGSLFVLLGLGIQVILIGVVVGMLCAAIASKWGIRPGWWFVVVEGIVFLFMNWLAFHEFRRGRTSWTGFDRAFFLIPRGIFRVRFGRETYAEALNDVAGFEVVPKSDSAANI